MCGLKMGLTAQNLFKKATESIVLLMLNVHVCMFTESIPIPKSGLSAAAIIAISVVCPLAFLATVVILVAVVKRRTL